MKCLNVAVLFALTVGGAAPALAEQKFWGTPESLKACEKDDSPECKAEIARRAQVCLSEPCEPKGTCRNTEEQKKTQCMTEAADDIFTQKRWVADHPPVELPTAAKHDAKLEKQIASVYHASYPEYKVLKVIITGRDWETEKDAFGRTTGRSIYAAIAQEKDKKCILYSSYWLQEGNGRKFSSKIQERGGASEQQEIPCEKVK
jgi:hypothetical protein